MVYVNRLLEKELQRYLNKKEILAVLGTRQCGKTTMLNYFLDSVEKKGKKVERLSFDNVKVLETFEKDIDLFIEKYVKGNEILFIDEVQYSKDSGKKLKYIYDNQKIKIILTGSSAPEISIQCLKYLVGRIFLFNLYPFNFEEFLSYQDKALYTIFRKGKISETSIESLNEYLQEFLTYGGYPAVVLEKYTKDKIKILEGIYSTFLLREIREILDLSNDDRLIKLVKALSLQIGNLVDYSELSRLTGFSIIEVKKYLNILEKTFILSELKPYFTNKRVELIKTPKIYFYDLGFRNICIDNFSKERSDMGAILENFIFNELVKAGNEKINFWRTKSKAEVDFIMEKNLELIPIEIKENLSGNNITLSFSSFIEKYSPKKAYALSKRFEGQRKKGRTKIIFVPFVKFIGLFKE